MKIGIFSKIEMSGGSEFRCITLANAIQKFTHHAAFILAEKGIPTRIEKAIDPEVCLIKNIFFPFTENTEILYDMDCIIVVNTDCKDFSNSSYWEGKSSRHNINVDLKRIRKMVFLYNFLVSPSRHLYTIEKKCKDVSIIVTNTKFFNEITKQDRYELIRHLPRLQLESPIDINSVMNTKIPSDIIRIGCHSKSLGNKWNEEYVKLVERINDRYGDRVSWDFLGISKKIIKEMDAYKNVTVRKEFSIPVKDFLKEIDIFCFFPSWKREEPWSRAVAEGIMSGCPVVATDKGGNKDQVIPGNNGFLCKTLSDFEKSIIYLIENPDMIKKFAQNSIRLSQDFTSESIVRKLMRFIL